MFLLIQIALTVAAWRRGWRAKALRPWVLALSTDFIAGFGAGMAGVHSTASLMPFIVLTSLAMTVALVAMSVIAPRRHMKPAAKAPIPATAHTTIDESIPC